MTARRHSAVCVDPSAECPFCGCGTVISAHTRPRARHTRTVKRYVPCACSFCEDGRRAPHTVGQILGQLAYLGGNCVPTGYSPGLGISPTYQAHLDAGEVAVPDVAAGGYRWEKAGATA